MTEKRKHHRVPVSIRVETEGEPVLGSGYAMNISEVGMAIDAQAISANQGLPNPGDVLRLKMMLPGADRVMTLHSSVTRIDFIEACPRIAVEFVGLSSQDRKEISQLVAAELNQK